MGCDIHLIAQRKIPSEGAAPAWAEKSAAAEAYEDVPGDFLDCRSYGLFAFLAGIRNYSGIEPISAPRGIPSDFHDEKHEFRDREEYGYHNPSWLSLQELLDCDYDQSIEDRRVMRNGDGGCTAEPGEGREMTLREFLGDWYFSELARMKDAGVDRIVFCFDS